PVGAHKQTANPPAARSPPGASGSSQAARGSPMLDRRRRGRRGALPPSPSPAAPPARRNRPNTRILPSLLFLLLSLLPAALAYPNSGGGADVCSLPSAIAAVSASPHGGPGADDGGFRLSVGADRDDLGTGTGRYNVRLSSPGSFRGVFLYTVHNRTNGYVGTFAPIGGAQDAAFPFNLTAKRDCNTTATDWPVLMHQDPGEKTGFSVQWRPGRWRRWNGMVVRVEGIVVQDLNNWFVLEPAFFTYVAAPVSSTTSTSRSTSSETTTSSSSSTSETATTTSTETPLEDGMYFTELATRTPESSTSITATTSRTRETLTVSITTTTVDVRRLIATKLDAMGDRTRTTLTTTTRTEELLVLRRTRTRTTTGPSLVF
ncbi:hypothetical protein DFJ74DRAFT_73703, partial [Hyaloraphidium curvatum]